MVPVVSAEHSLFVMPEYLCAGKCLQASAIGLHALSADVQKLRANKDSSLNLRIKASLLPFARFLDFSYWFLILLSAQISCISTCKTNQAIRYSFWKSPKMLIKPISTVHLVITIIKALFSAGRMLKSLFNALKSNYGQACTSTSKLLPHHCFSPIPPHL